MTSNLIEFHSEIAEEFNNESTGGRPIWWMDEMNDRWMNIAAINSI